MNVSVKNISGLFPKTLLIILLAFGPFMVSAQETDNIKKTYEWTTYKEYGGIKVEYKFSDCNSVKVQNQTLVLLRYTNTTNNNLALTYKVKEYRDGECYNCHKLETDEYKREVKLSPGEVASGSCESRDDRAFFIFGNYINLAPGMTEQYLTNFEFINVESYVWK